MTEKIKKKILVAVDGSRHSNYALDYTSSVISQDQNTDLVLIHVHPRISDYIEQEAKTQPAAKRELDRIFAKNKLQSQNLLEEASQRLVAAGVPERAIQTISHLNNEGVAADIMNFANQRQVDAIVVGPKGLSKLQGLFTVIVSNQLVQESAVIPLWLVGENVKRQKVLVASDGSESALRAIDHLAFMLRGTETVQITLLHVRPRLRDFCEIDFTEPDPAAPLEEVLRSENDKCVDDWYARAKKLLTDAGIPDEHLEVKVVDSLRNIGGTIVAEAEKGGIDSIVLGRSGRDKKRSVGGTTQRVLNEGQNFAVWVVP